MIRLAFIFAFLALSAHADPVSIRSGEHATFTRLVLSIEDGASWTIDTTQTGYDVRIASLQDGFDTSGVFERIPRTRLKSMSQVAQDTLSLDVDCLCHVDSFLWRSDRLVIDIVDGVLPPAAEPESFDFRSNTLEPSVASAIERLPDLIDLPNGLTLVPNSSLSAARVDIHEVENDEINQDADPEAQSRTSTLIAGIARGASQGLLDPAVEFPPPPNVENQTPNVHVEDAAPVPWPETPDAQGIGLGVSTSLDQTFSSIAESLDQLDRPHCVGADTFDIRTWSDGRSFHEQFADLTLNLLGEFDEIPVDAKQRLAEFYIYFGFGSEAYSILKSDEARSRNRLIRMEMARLIDDFPDDYPMLKGQIDCVPDAAIWAVIAGADIPDSDDQVQDLLRAHFQIPQPLRRYLAPRVSERFLNAGRLDASQSVLRSNFDVDVSSATGDSNVEAHIALELQDRKRAIELLAHQVRDRPHTDPDTAIQFIELSLLEGQMPSDQDLLVLEGLMTEYRGTEDYPKLGITLARALSARGEHRAALTLMEERSDEDAVIATDQVFQDLIQNSDPSSFLEVGFEELPREVSTTTENAFAHRLIQLGFYQRALEILDGPAVQDAAAERRYLRSEAALGSEDFALALDSIAGINTPRADMLRASAYMGLEEYSSALSAEPPNSEADNSVQIFRAEAWERLALSEDTALADFAQIKADEINFDAPPNLGDARALLETSQESRRAIEGLLTRFSGDASGF